MNRSRQTAPKEPTELQIFGGRLRAKGYGYEHKQQALIDAGYEPFRGTPVGYLYDVPAISAEIKNLTDKVAKDHPDRGWYSSDITLRDGSIILEVSFPGGGKAADR